MRMLLKNAKLEEQDKQSLEVRNALLSTAFEASAALLSAYYDNARNQLNYNTAQELSTVEDLHDRKKYLIKNMRLKKSA